MAFKILINDETKFFNFDILVTILVYVHFSKPILSVEEYEEAPASALLRFALASGSFTVILSFL
jgi:hypothetical protein